MLDIMYSVVTPVFNEEETIVEFYNRLSAVMNSLGQPYEIIFVNDGSSDKSFEILLNLRRSNKNVKIVDFSRNFGHQIAISSGIYYSKGKAVIVMDSDLQDPPEFIPELIKKYKEGYDVVYAIRKQRKEGIIKRIAYSSFYRLFNKISHTEIPLDTGDFCIMDRKVVRQLNLMPERHRFVRGIRSWIGFKQTGLEYERDKRFSGKPKYTYSKLFKLAFDGVFSLSYLPLRVSAFVGVLVSLLSFIAIILVIYLKLFTDIVVKGIAAPVIFILFLGGVQLIAIGLIGEYIGRIYDEVKRRPLYIIRQLVGIDEDI
jgi:dolichol-phosphate mannosyltransferase